MRDKKTQMNKKLLALSLLDCMTDKDALSQNSPNAY
jgi:hypothetical protein